MKFLQKATMNLLAMGALFLATASVSHALPYTYTYASAVRWDNGSGATPSSTPGSRYNQSSALGSPDAGASTNFLSLGLGGLAVFDFGTEFDAAAIVFETTGGVRSNYPEYAKVYVADSSFNFAGLNSDNGAATISTVGFDFVAQISNAIAITELDLSSLTGPFRYVLIQDVTPGGGPSTEGFDVDAVGVAPVPEPGTMMLLGLGMAGLAIYGKRRKNNRA